MSRLREPYLSEFKDLIRGGAASRDVHDAADRDAHFAKMNGYVDDAYLMREVARASTHLCVTVPMFAPAVGRAPKVLDFGCGTGGTTVAIALAEGLADEVIGVDANADALRAAEVRARGHELAAPRIRFQRTVPGEPLPFADGAFDLVVTVSVLEFISQPAAREQVVNELRRVVAPGGYLFIATPRPGVREHHSRLWFGDVRRVDGVPWSSPPWHLARWARGWQRLPTPLPTRARHLAARLPARGLVERAMQVALPLAGSWQRLLIRRPR